jgi:5-methylcytosine-specific restriction enzyme A
VTDRVRGRKLQERRAMFFAINPLCVMCKAEGRITPARELDHIKALVKGGSDEPDNWQALCIDCHKDKTSKDLGHTIRQPIGIDGWPCR